MVKYPKPYQNITQGTQVGSIPDVSGINEMLAALANEAAETNKNLRMIGKMIPLVLKILKEPEMDPIVYRKLQHLALEVGTDTTKDGF